MSMYYFMYLYIPLLQENTTDCGRGHAFRPSIHTLLILQLLLLALMACPHVLPFSL